ncbi:MAG TPA: helix-hairpin-helix domain-containing protein [Candidatus Cloacimonas sp.]|nr:helix-hairpin-helix domain-containing protein [Candidatus Cloacimonas sp.]HPS60465.1 helix-hairpin-helix domain-containing protein [Candidatus Cloacimonas sp.]
MKKFLLMLFVLAGLSVLAAKVDLNTASLAELMQLPITEKQAKDIYEYREFVKIFDDIYELKQIPSIDQETLDRLKQMAVVSIFVETDEAAVRREEIRDLMERVDSNEGASEGMADVWEDYLMTPQNVNKMLFDDLMSFPNVSGIDAVAVLKRIAQGDTIADTRDLRNSTGLSYYGYTNLRSYVYYKEPPVKNRLMCDASLLYYTRYFEEGQYDMLHESFLRNDYNAANVIVPHLKTNSYWGYFGLDELDPDIMLKLRMRYGNNYKLGFMNYKAKGEEDLLNSQAEDILADSKWYAGYENNNMPGLYNSRLKVYAGNYRATFGEGLVMENTDYYSARKTGFGFSKRILGITPDLSRTQENSLRGGAVEYTTPLFGVTAFASVDDKDALTYVDKYGNAVMRDEYGNDIYTDRDTLSVNYGHQYYVDVNGQAVYNYENGNAVQGDKTKVFSLVNPTLRYDDDTMLEAEQYFNSEISAGMPYAMNYINLAARKDIVQEKLWGTHLQVNPFLGTKLGFTTYTAIYDDAYFVVPTYNNLLQTLLRDSYYYSKLVKNMNAEISNLYSTQTDKYTRDYRRVIGFDAQTVIGNTSIQGEYAELSVDGEDLKLGDDPKAYLVSAHTLYENLYFITLFRNYDVAFDNPYSNSFSEHQRFEDTILEKNIYALTNPTIADLYQNSNQSQPERGVYFETRYKFNRYFTIGRSYIDLWERLTDGRRSARFQSELEFRPLYQLALRLRYKNQVNRYDDDAERGVSKTNEYTLAVRSFLSNRDFFELEYRYNTVWNPPYTSLTYPAVEGENSMAASQTLMIGDYIAVNYTHYFNKSLKMQGSFLYWFGHGISHWDWEDMEIDFMGEKGSKAWVAFTSRISQNMYLNLKFKNKTYQDKEINIRNYNISDDSTLLDDPVNFQRVEHSENTIRLSIDYRY